ncbi:YncE family protein [Lysinibacter cavernae]|uniref:YVTN family beta-propeller protein n=1 Tax=Lysinibacter cavernae TaxID=1640652 RepID=A0A7X5TRM0_9MICO|nr:hypothetical protein [Lysinibacter cavernae]NIH52341.1 YVTN family beta-propeller protein [Lysinibacter cavernae]
MKFVDGASNRLSKTVYVPGSVPATPLNYRTYGSDVDETKNQYYIAVAQTNTAYQISPQYNYSSEKFGYDITFARSILVNPTNRKVWILGSSHMWRFHADTFSLEGMAGVPNADYRETVINRTNSQLYFTNSNTNNTVTVFDGLGMKVITTVTVGTAPRGLALDTTRNLLYVANSKSSSVSVIDTLTNTLVDTITVSANPIGVAVDSLRNKIFVTHHSNLGEFATAQSGTGSIDVIDGATRTIEDVISTPSDAGGTDIRVNQTTGIIYGIAGTDLYRIEPRA